jgi:hypothetical protein
LAFEAESKGVESFSLISVLEIVGERTTADRAKNT